MNCIHLHRLLSLYLQKEIVSIPIIFIIRYTKKDATELEESLETVKQLEAQLAEAKAAKANGGAGGSGGGSKIDKEDIKNLQKECKQEKIKVSSSFRLAIFRSFGMS